MTMELNWLSLLYLLGTAQGLFLGLALLTTGSGSARANRYLAILTLLFAAVLFESLIGHTADTRQFVPMYVVFWPKEFWFGPLIYFYVLTLTRPDRAQTTGWRWLHWLPAILHCLLSWSLLIFPVPRIISILGFNSPAAGTDTVLAILFQLEAPVAVFHIGAYLLTALLALRAHTRSIRETFSYTDKISLSWLRNLLIAMAVLYLMYSFEVLGEDYFQLTDFAGSVTNISIALVIYLMGYMGLRQPAIFTRKQSLQATAGEKADINQIPVESIPVGVIDSSDAKYSSSSLTRELSAALLVEIKGLMEGDSSLWLDSRLTLSQLAEEVGVSANYVSQAINQHGRSFFDFVNEYRVGEACRLLVADDFNGVLSVAMASGFNSKSAFYTAFKKHTGATPSEYRAARRSSSS